MKILNNFLANSYLKKLNKEVAKINKLEPQLEKLTDSELRDKTFEFKERLKNGETTDDILVEAFAVCREGAKRSMGMRHYDVQLLGGMVLHSGQIAEMRTGEGKTLVATLPVYLNALEGKGVHVVTVNDYLAKRDAEQMSKLYSFLGLTTGVVIHGVDNSLKRRAYRADITYGTNNEFGFDYLRDNMVSFRSQMVQRKPHFAIVDEVDSILIDEARTPLIISGPGDKSSPMYAKSNSFVSGLVKNEDYIVDEKENAATYTDKGLEKAEIYFNVSNMTSIENMDTYHYINQALKANTLMNRDIDYVVREDEILIVDEFTGRLMEGRRYSDGLHQAIETKENIKANRESKTLATVTFQNYFRMYPKLSGMTGTAKTEEEEFVSIYGMNVVTIPTNKPILRVDQNDVVYGNKEAKYNAVVEEVARIHQTKQPILIGTISIENSEMLSDLLTKKGIKHEVLNAKNHAKEAEIVAQAGRLNQVTIATNMAGRGTDIILGGNPEFLAINELRNKGYAEDIISQVNGYNLTDDEVLLEARADYKEILKAKKAELMPEQEKVKEVGGLYIIGTERHESRRIDNQLRGRAGRQGDPGETRFFLSLEDDLLRLFGSERLQGMIDLVGLEDDEPIEANMLSKSIEVAQKTVEGLNYSVRKTVLQYDDIMNKQREIIYGERERVLNGEDLENQIQDMIKSVAKDLIEKQLPEGEEDNWDFHALSDMLKHDFGIVVTNSDLDKIPNKVAVKGNLVNIILKAYKYKQKMMSQVDFRELERMILLQIVDKKWMDHIDSMDQLRKGIGLRAIGQENPTIAYQKEGFEMFDDMNDAIRKDIVRYVTTFQIPKREEPEEKERTAIDFSESQEDFTERKTIASTELCPCNSGKEYQFCHGQNKEGETPENINTKQLEP